MTPPAPALFYMLFDGPPKDLIPHFAFELAERDAQVRALKTLLARLSLPYRLRRLSTKGTRPPLAGPQMGLANLPIDALRQLTHNADARFRLHGIEPGFTLVEGLRFPTDLNQSYLPVTRICTKANLRLFTFFAGANQLRFSIQGPGSGLRVRRAWCEDGQSAWKTEDKGEPHAIEEPGTTLSRHSIQDMLERLSPALPKALRARRFEMSWEFRPGLVGTSVTKLASQGQKA